MSGRLARASSSLSIHQYDVRDAPTEPTDFPTMLEARSEEASLMGCGAPSEKGNRKKKTVNNSTPLSETTNEAHLGQKGLKLWIVIHTRTCTTRERLAEAGGRENEVNRNSSIVGRDAK